MAESAYSPAVLVVDDDQAFTNYFRERCYEDTNVGVLVANDLSSAKRLIDDERLFFDAIVSDLFF